MPRQARTTTLRIDRFVIAAAKPVLDDIGLSVEDAVKVFLRQVAIRRALPFALEAVPASGGARIATHHGKSHGMSASMCAGPDGFYVLAGSRIVPREGAFQPPSAYRNRCRHAADIDEAGRLLRDIRFKSISGAACFVCGGNVNGNVFWRDAQNQR